MASATKNGPSEGVEFIYEDDGSVTAKDIESGLARGKGSDDVLRSRDSLSPD
uniref:type II toxin-antitoxin system HicB family antitoxin n=1 Tax=Halorussus ruber TaxID=1126238 RepID=UPI00143CD2D2|nr:hypothetical protein [Halorussus ruber]